MESIKISIIIPVYNMQEYIAVALESIQKQTLKDIEIICIDDGSVDCSKDIIGKYRENDKRINLICTNNQGAGKARNQGIRVAKGEFIFFLDADDYLYDATALESLYHAAIKNDVLVCGGSAYLDRQGKVINESDERVKRMIFEKDEVIEYSDYQGDYWYWRFIYSRKMLIENDFFFPDYKRYQDPPFLLKVMSHCGKFMALKKVVYCYREAHKEVSWTEEKAVDVLKGMRDEIILTKKMGYNQLHKEVVERLHGVNRIPVYRAINSGNADAVKCVTQINENIDWNILQKEETKVNLKYLNVEQIRKSIQKAEKESAQIINILNNGKPFILYGAGIIGERFVNAFSIRDNENMIGFAVSDAQNKEEELCGFKIYHISKLMEYCDDAYVFVTTGVNLHDEIMTELEKKGFKNILPIDWSQLRLVM